MRNYLSKYLAPLVAASAVIAWLSAASAAAVTKADFAGKKICWNSGSSTSTSSYGAGGEYSSSVTGTGTWSMSGSGLHIHTNQYDYVATIQKTPGGTFEADIAGPSGHLKATGKYCQ